jgi:hypothetical protein
MWVAEPGAAPGTTGPPSPKKDWGRVAAAEGSVLGAGLLSE